MTKVNTSTIRKKEEDDASLFISGMDKEDGAGSDSESENEDERAHNNLLSDIGKLSKKKRIGAAPRSVRFSTKEGGTKVDTADILKRIGIQHVEKNTKKVQALPAPLEKVVVKRAQRIAGYDKVARESEKWAGLVHRRRLEDQLTFPLQQPDLRIHNTLKHEEEKMNTPLEKEVYALLQGAKLTENKKESNEERARKLAMSLEELKERNRMLWKEREHRRRIERKAWMQNKNKSRKYHRLLRKDKLRKQKMELEELQKSNPEAALEKLEELERARVHERMTLRHKHSKWAHLQGMRVTRDETARSALKENLGIHQDLTAKRKLDDSSSEDEDEEMLKEKLESLRKERQDAIEAGLFDPSNPWTANLLQQVPERVKMTPESAVDDSFVNFKRFWEEVNRRKLIEKKALEVAAEKERLAEMSKRDKEEAEGETDESAEDMEVNDNDGMEEVDTVLKGGLENSKTKVAVEKKIVKSKESCQEKSLKKNKTEIENDNNKLENKAVTEINEQMTNKKMKNQKKEKKIVKSEDSSQESSLEIDKEDGEKPEKKDEQITTKKIKNKNTKKNVKSRDSSQDAILSNDKTMIETGGKNLEKKVFSEVGEQKAIEIGVQKNDKKIKGKKNKNLKEDLVTADNTKKLKKNKKDNLTNVIDAKKITKKGDIEVGNDLERMEKDSTVGKKKKAKKDKIRKKNKGKETKGNNKTQDEEAEETRKDVMNEDLEDHLVSIDNMFSQAELGLQKKLKKKLEKLGIDASAKKEWTVVKSKKKQKTESSLPKIEEYEFTAKKGDIIDEGLEHVRTMEDMDSLQNRNEDQNPLKKAVALLKDDEKSSNNSNKTTQQNGSRVDSDKKPSSKPVQVDPSKFLQVDAKVLQAAMPDKVSKEMEDLDDEEEDEEEEDADDVIRQAFADDYLIDEFKSAKDEAIEKDKPKTLSLVLPGWGEWTGPNIKVSKRKKRRFTVNMPPPPERKDSTMGNVIYNEEADVHDKLRKAMVSELPYPFSRVQDFEASIRAPVGRMFIPEKQHHMLTAPAVITKMGTRIEPMTEEELLKNEHFNKQQENKLKRVLEAKRNRKRNKINKNKK